MGFLLRAFFTFITRYRFSYVYNGRFNKTFSLRILYFKQNIPFKYSIVIRLTLLILLLHGLYDFIVVFKRISVFLLITVLGGRLIVLKPWLFSHELDLLLWIKWCIDSGEAVFFTLVSDAAITKFHWVWEGWKYVAGEHYYLWALKWSRGDCFCYFLIRNQLDNYNACIKLNRISF